MLYWIFQTILVAGALGVGWMMTADSRRGRLGRPTVWMAALLVLAYAFAKGLRWDRGVDFGTYWYHYVFDNAPHTYEPLFDLTTRALRALCVPDWGYFTFLSLFFIVSVLVLAARMRRWAVWALPAMMLMTEYPAENLIRQFYALSWLMISVALWISGGEAHREGRRRWIRCGAWLTLCAVPLVHVTGLCACVPVAIMRLWHGKYTPGEGKPSPDPTPWILLGGYGVFWAMRLSGSAHSLSDGIVWLADYARLPLSDHWQLYLDHASAWFAPVDPATVHHSPVGDAVQVAWPAALLTGGWFAMRAYPNLRIPYWLCAGGILLTALLGEVHVWKRVAWWGTIFMPFVGGALIGWLYGEARLASPRSGRRRLLISLDLLCVALYLLAYVTPFISRWGTVPHSGWEFVWSAPTQYPTINPDLP